MRLLLVEDDELLGQGIKQALTREGFQLEWLTDGLQAIAALETDEFDLVILDLGLPGKDGLEVLSHARQQGCTSPVLILTARDTLDDKIRGLDSGADDYLVKPFELAELNARIRALTRRHHGHVEPVIQYAAITLDPAAKQVTLEGQDIKLSRREYTLLLEFLNHPGRVMSKEKLEDVIYGWDGEIESNSIEVHIHHLRKKLYAGLIKTVRGLGYKIDKL